MANESVKQIALEAKKASTGMGIATLEVRNAALSAMANALRENVRIIMEANEKDMNAAHASGVKDGILDRLMLNGVRIEGMASALEDLMKLEDPLGVVQHESTLYNGIALKRVSVPLGVVAMVYEARPNVTADAAGICVKTGNACVLRGGSLAAHSNAILANLLHEAAVLAGLPQNCIRVIETTDRSATDELMSLHGIVDVLIPRGGAGLIKHCVENAKVPVIETGTGNCHIYVHEKASFEMARDIVINAKCRRVGVCNAAEGLLVDEVIAAEFLPEMLQALSEKGIDLHLDEKSYAIARDVGIKNIAKATPEDWGTEYLAEEISVKCVSGIQEAIEHINTYGTKHSEAIVTDDAQAGDLFSRAIDAAAVYVNASTAFTDGGEFGMGAEIGISTQKLHARGPFALNALTSYKYVLHGNGQVRD